MWQALAAWIVENPAAAAGAIGAAVAVIVQGSKRLFGIQSGEGAWIKRLTAALVAAIGTWATAVLAGAALDAGQLVGVAITAWLSAQGVHALALKGEKTE